MLLDVKKVTNSTANRWQRSAVKVAADGRDWCAAAEAVPCCCFPDVRDVIGIVPKSVAYMLTPTRRLPSAN